MEKWTLVEETATYVTEMSSLDFVREKGIDCPHCKQMMEIFEYREEKSWEGELMAWSCRCKGCGASLKIFND